MSRHDDPTFREEVEAILEEAQMMGMDENELCDVPFQLAAQFADAITNYSSDAHQLAEQIHEFIRQLPPQVT